MLEAWLRGGGSGEVELTSEARGSGETELAPGAKGSGETGFALEPRYPQAFALSLFAIFIPLIWVSFLWYPTHSLGTALLTYI